MRALALVQVVNCVVFKGPCEKRTDGRKGGGWEETRRFCSFSLGHDGDLWWSGKAGFLERRTEARTGLAWFVRLNEEDGGVGDAA